eukprot:gene789-4077_t
MSIQELQCSFSIIFEDLLSTLSTGRSTQNTFSDQNALPNTLLSLVSSDQLGLLSRRFQNSLKDAVVSASRVTPSENNAEAQMLADIGDSIARRGGFILPELQAWSSKHFAEADRQCLQMFRQKSRFDRHQQYWPTVIRLICHGRMKEASQILQLHSNYPSDTTTTNSLRTVEELIRRMPTYQPGVPRTDFASKWNLWKKHVNDRTRDIEDPNLSTVASLLRGGDDTIFRSLMETYRMHWIELFLAKMLFSEPAVLLIDLDTYLELEWVEKDLHFTILSGNAIETLSMASQTNWLVESNKGILDELTMTYGEELLHAGMWRVAANYLTRCGPQGFEQLSSTLAQMPLSTEKLATQVWRCCHDFELMDLGNFVLPLLLYCLPMLYSYKFFIPAAQICIKMATELECVGLHVSALSWLIRGGHNLRITRMVDELLLKYARTHDPQDLSVAQHFIQSSASCPRLQFAAKYKEIQDCILEGYHQHAVKGIMEMLTDTTLVPKWFWVHILIDIVPLLENGDVLFSAFETKSLIQCLEEVEMSHSFEEYKSTFPDKKKVAIGIEEIRMALARNLARALLVQPVN